MKTKLLILLPLLLFLGCEDSDSEKTPTKPGQPESYHYQLPVIFHALYKFPSDPEQYVTSKRIKEIITACNKYYQNRLGINSVNMNLEFVLATEDPDGRPLPEPGINRIQVENPVMDCEKFMFNKANLKYLWDVDKYINIMLYTFAQDEDSKGTILGISHIPYTIAPDYLRGLRQIKGIPTHNSLLYPHCVSINNEFIYDEASDETKLRYNSTDVVPTLAHELGHYLGLFHAFSEEEGKDEGKAGISICKDTDYCDDTPTYDRDAYIKWMAGYIASKAGIENMSLQEFNKLLERRDCVKNTVSTPNNIMDYDISWVNRFTPNQRERIRYVLTHSPFIPGPKVARTTTRTLTGPQELPARAIK